MSARKTEFAAYSSSARGSCQYWAWQSSFMVLEEQGFCCQNLATIGLVMEGFWGTIWACVILRCYIVRRMDYGLGGAKVLLSKSSFVKLIAAAKIDRGLISWQDLNQEALDPPHVCSVVEQPWHMWIIILNLFWLNVIQLMPVGRNLFWKTPADIVAQLVIFSKALWKTIHSLEIKHHITR